MRDASSMDESVREWPEYLSLTVGALYGLVGLAGFLWTGVRGFASSEGDLILGVFEVNPLHNIVHFATGAILVGAFFAGRRAVAYVAGIVALGFLLVGAAGFFLTGSEANILALNTADHWLHLFSGVVVGIAAVAAWRGRRERGAVEYPAEAAGDERQRRRAA